ncbi:MAG TPA: GNAT family protein [Chloroflexota bacterium]
MEASEQAQSIVNIVGEKVALGPYRRDLLPTYTRWINDLEVTRTLSIHPGPYTAEQEEQWYERASRTENTVDFTIYERSTMRPIGNTGFHNVDFFHRSAEFGILIGEKDCWGKGYGTEATILVLRYGFQYLNLHSIMLHVHAYNERGIRAYRRAGFKEAGRLRECHALGGKMHDLLIMDCLSREFEGTGA